MGTCVSGCSCTAVVPYRGTAIPYRTVPIAEPLTLYGTGRVLDAYRTVATRILCTGTTTVDLATVQLYRTPYYR
jgi:hypothetical protein